MQTKEEELDESYDDILLAIDNIPCAVARVGEMTYECGTQLCTLCTWRKKIRRLVRESYLEEVRGFKKDYAESGVFDYLRKA